MSEQNKEVGVTSYMPGTDGFTMACFHAKDVPVGTKLYVASKFPAPIPEQVAASSAGLEGMTRYAVGGSGDLEEMECGDAYLVADVERLLATQSAKQGERQIKKIIFEWKRYAFSTSLDDRNEDLCSLIEEMELAMNAKNKTLADAETDVSYRYYVNPGEVHRMKWPDMSAADELHPSLDHITICILVLNNGMTVVGEYFSTGEDRFDAERNRKLAHENAISKALVEQAPVAQEVTQQAAKAETGTAQEIIEISVDYPGCRHVAPIKRVTRTDGRLSVLVEGRAPTTSTVSASGALAAADDVRDAGRYRWLRERNNNLDAVTEAGAILFGKRLDQAIDAEMQMTTAAQAATDKSED